MQFKKITDYAFRIVLFLSGCQMPRKVKEISEGAEVPEQKVPQIMKVLREAGIVYLDRGKNGGYALAKAPEKIFPYDVVELFEPSMKLNHCMEYECDRGLGDGRCPVKNYLEEVQMILDRKLKGVSYLDLYEQMVSLQAIG